MVGCHHPVIILCGSRVAATQEKLHKYYDYSEGTFASCICIKCFSKTQMSFYDFHSIYFHLLQQACADVVLTNGVLTGP